MLRAAGALRHVATFLAQGQAHHGPQGGTGKFQAGEPERKRPYARAPSNLESNTARVATRLLDLLHKHTSMQRYITADDMIPVLVHIDLHPQTTKSHCRVSNQSQKPVTRRTQPYMKHNERIGCPHHSECMQGSMGHTATLIPILVRIAFLPGQYKANAKHQINRNILSRDEPKYVRCTVTWLAARAVMSPCRVPRSTRRHMSL